MMDPEELRMWAVERAYEITRPGGAVQSGPPADLQGLLKHAAELEQFVRDGAKAAS